MQDGFVAYSSYSAPLWLTCLDTCVQQVEQQIFWIHFDLCIIHLHMYFFEKMQCKMIQYLSIE